IAASESYCSYYASEAQQAARSVQDESGLIFLGGLFGVQPAFGSLDLNYPLPQNCGYSGLRWSTNYDEQYNWCLGVDEATANAEIGARTFEAQYCSVCIEYVNAASEFEDEARKLNCPLRGPRWPSDANGNGLMQFCLAQGHSDIAATVKWLQGVLNNG